jgi:hypothetical protein
MVSHPFHSFSTSKILTSAVVFFCPIDTANLVHPGAFLAPRFDNTLNGLLKSGGDEVSDGSDPAPI